MSKTITFNGREYDAQPDYDAWVIVPYGETEAHVFINEKSLGTEWRLLGKLSNLERGMIALGHECEGRSRLWISEQQERQKQATLKDIEESLARLTKRRAEITGEQDIYPTAINKLDVYGAGVQERFTAPAEV